MTAEGETKAAEGIPLSEVEKHTTAKDVWIVINNKVYNVTKYLDEHPGGGEVLLQSAGKDATDDFEATGHSDGARKILKEYYIGEFAGGPSSKPKPSKAEASEANPNAMAKLLQFLLPIIVILLAVAVFYVNTDK